MIRRSRFIVAIISIAIIGGATVIVINMQKTQDTKKTQITQITENKELVGTRMKSKKITDKIMLEKNVQAKKIANKITDDKYEATKIVSEKVIQNKLEAAKIANKKVRLAKLNTGLTLSEALAIGEKLDTYTNTTLKILDSNMSINGSKFYVFELCDLSGNDEGADFHICINKITGKASKYYSDGTLRDYISGAVANTAITITSNVTVLRYVINGENFTSCNYTNGVILHFKVGQTLDIQGNLIGKSTQRTMFMNGGTIFSSGPSNNIKMVAAGNDDITIIPDGYNWASAYTFHIVVTN